MNTLIHPTYFPSISHFVAMAQADKITFEIEDNFQKQTNRNRTYIYSPNGILLLNIPIKHSKENRQKTKEIRIEPDFDWQKQHFKSLEAAYRSSPFFEFFEDDLRPLFEKKYEFLLDLNFEVLDIVFKCLRMKVEYNKTTEYFHQVDENNISDYRNLVEGKKDISEFEKYTQVFDDKYGFLNNLSILDLLFNEGKYAMEYLKEQKLIIK
ncbi:WbqC family protein [Flavobacterium sp. P4023]|uniref:WbqC family protein n=1 Tax=Flavobacterium flabelliforme TaxID=2816119 RepID=A0ABS5CP09_9FLAO|nr:WbqC family protein [Flavobacterium flabelliforme]MBP4140352.1 WbqC family protein [Flavobacterium flabelliforme]